MIDNRFQIFLIIILLMAVGGLCYETDRSAPPCSSNLGEDTGALSKQATQVVEKVIMAEVGAESASLKKLFTFGDYIPATSNVPGLKYGFQEMIMHGKKGYDKHIFQPIYVYENGFDSLVMMGMFAGRDKVVNNELLGSYITTGKGKDVVDILEGIGDWTIVKKGNVEKEIVLITDPDCPACRTQRSDLVSLEKMIPDLQVRVVYHVLSGIHPNAKLKASILLGVESDKRVLAEELLSRMDTSDRGKMLKVLDVAEVPYKELSSKDIEQRLAYGDKLAKLLEETGTPVILLPSKKLVLHGYSNYRVLQRMLGHSNES